MESESWLPVPKSHRISRLTRWGPRAAAAVVQRARDVRATGGRQVAAINQVPLPPAPLSFDLGGISKCGIEKKPKKRRKPNLCKQINRLRHGPMGGVLELFRFSPFSLFPSTGRRFEFRSGWKFIRRHGDWPIRLPSVDLSVQFFLTWQKKKKKLAAPVGGSRSVVNHRVDHALARVVIDAQCISFFLSLTHNLVATFKNKFLKIHLHTVWLFGMPVATIRSPPVGLGAVALFKNEL